MSYLNRGVTRGAARPEGRQKGKNKGEIGRGKGEKSKRKNAK